MKTDRNSSGSTRLAWAITLGYAILYGGIVFVVSQYWLMLPIWLRTIAALGLIFVAGVGLIRIKGIYGRRKTAETKDNNAKAE